MKKLFECGHKGRGKDCHRCEQAAAKAFQAKNEKDEKKAAELKAAAEKLYAVPQKKSNAPMMPSDPVPA